MMYGRAWLKAVMASKVSPKAKAVAWAIEDRRNNETGLCYPSARTLAEDTGLSSASVNRAVRELEQGGWLTRTEGRGRGNHTRYTLVMQGKVVPIRVAQKPIRPDISTRENRSERAGKPIRPDISYNKDDPPKETQRARATPLTTIRSDRDRVSSDRDRAVPRPPGAVIDLSDAAGIDGWDRWLRSEGLGNLDAATFLAEAGPLRGYAVPSRYPPSRPDDAEKARAFFAACAKKSYDHHRRRVIA